MARPVVVAVLLGLTACRAGNASGVSSQGASPAPKGTVAAPTSAAPVGSVAPSIDPLRVVDPQRLRILARVPAYYAEADGDRVFALDPQVETLRGFDLANGHEVWSSKLGVEASGQIDLHPAFGAKRRLLVHVGNQLLTFDRDTGALAARTTGPWSGPHSRLSNERGACSFASSCDLHLVDCEDARPYGPIFRIAETHLYAKLGAPHDTVCWGPLHLVGRGGNVVVVVADGRVFEQPDVAKADGPITVGVEAGTGKVVWTSRSIGCEHCITSGVSPDGATCWLGGLTASGAKLDVFSCATGKLQFQKTIPESALAEGDPYVHTTWAQGGLMLSTAKDVALLDRSTGKARWSLPLPPAALGLPLATPLELPAFSGWQARTVLLLDAKAGKEIARFALPGYTELLQSPDLGLRVKGGPAFDPQGKSRTVDDTPLFTLARDQAPRLLMTGAGHHLLAQVSTDLAIVASRRTPQGDELALFVWPPKNATGELIFARVTPP